MGVMGRYGWGARYRCGRKVWVGRYYGEGKGEGTVWWGKVWVEERRYGFVGKVWRYGGKVLVWWVNISGGTVYVEGML